MPKASSHHYTDNIKSVVLVASPAAGTICQSINLDSNRAKHACCDLHDKTPMMAPTATTATTFAPFEAPTSDTTIETMFNNNPLLGKVANTDGCNLSQLVKRPMPPISSSLDSKATITDTDSQMLSFSVESADR